jgi:hypothetical protein
MSNEHSELPSHRFVATHYREVVCGGGLMGPALKLELSDCGAGMIELKLSSG